MFGWLRHKKICPPECDVTTLATMKPGESGLVVDVRGGHNVVERLASLGIRPGKRVVKVSSMLLGGPVTVEVELFTWEKLDYVEKIRKEFGL